MNNKLVTLCVAVAFLTGCATGGPNQTGGTLIGGAAGALVGSQFGKGHGRLAGVAVGALLGSAIGGSIGKSMDQVDKQMQQETTYYALVKQPDNSVSTWHNPNKAHSGSVIVTQTIEKNDKVCRDFVQTVIIDGKQEEVAGRACRDVRDAKGQWVLQR